MLPLPDAFIPQAVLAGLLYSGEELEAFSDSSPRDTVGSQITSSLTSHLHVGKRTKKAL